MALFWISGFLDIKILLPPLMINMKLLKVSAESPPRSKLQSHSSTCCCSSGAMGKNFVPLAAACAAGLVGAYFAYNLLVNSRKKKGTYIICLLTCSFISH